GFNKNKDFSAGDYKHLNVDNLSASQAFSTPLSHFSENAHSVGFQQLIADGYSVTASLRQGQVSETFTDDAESLKTISMTLALNSELTPQFRET
ncbi:hypothetical protein N9V90_01785, partial [Endozoicomonas sp.]|nr:hypothetical protein [Endozoicomonas sp.]